MSPEAEFIVAHSATHKSSTSLDVFGNDLEDVDVWGDDKQEENGVSNQGVVGTRHTQPHRDPGHETHGGVPKPPRSARQRELSTELLQKYGTVLKNPARRVRRGSLSDGGKNSNQNSVSSSMSHLPPMTPRTRSRKLGLSVVLPVPVVEAAPKVKTLSVAEKRRMRSEELSSASKSLEHQHDETVAPHDGTQQWNLSGEEWAKSQRKMQSSLFQELQTKTQTLRRARNYSETQLPHISLDLFQSLDNDGFDAECLFPPNLNERIPAREITGSSNVENKTHRRPRTRESRKDTNEIVAPVRSQSLPRRDKSLRKHTRPVVSDHQASTEPSHPNVQKRRSKSTTVDPSDELHKHLKSLFTKENGAKPSAIMKNSTQHSESTNSSKSSSQSREKESSDQTEIPDNSPTSKDAEIARPTPCSRRRRDPPPKGPAASNPVQRSSSVPRAGEKIRFVRGNRDGTKVTTKTDNADAVSTSERSTKSTRSRQSSQSFNSARSGRRASLSEGNSANTSPRRGRPPACPPSPSVRNRKDAATGAKTLSNSGVPEDDARRSARTSRSPGKGRADDGERTTPRVSGSPRRQIRYVRKDEGDPSKVASALPILG